MTAALRTHLADLASHLGPDELRVLTRIGERLTLGRRLYGELRLATDSRDWRREASEESLDLSVYLAISLLAGTADTVPPPAPTEPRIQGTEP